MLKAASSDSAAEETLQTRICQTRCSFSRRRRGHLLSQPSRSRGEGEPVRGGGVDVRLWAGMNMLTPKSPVTEGRSLRVSSCSIGPEGSRTNRAAGNRPSRTPSHRMSQRLRWAPAGLYPRVPPRLISCCRFSSRPPVNHRSRSPPCNHFKFSR